MAAGAEPAAGGRASDAAEVLLAGVQCNANAAHLVRREFVTLLPRWLARGRSLGVLVGGGREDRDDPVGLDVLALDHDQLPAAQVAPVACSGCSGSQIGTCLAPGLRISDRTHQRLCIKIQILQNDQVTAKVNIFDGVGI